LLRRPPHLVRVPGPHPGTGGRDCHRDAGRGGLRPKASAMVARGRHGAGLDHRVGGPGDAGRRGLSTVRGHANPRLPRRHVARPLWPRRVLTMTPSSKLAAMIPELAAWVRDARERTIELAADLSGEQLWGPRLSIVNPMIWEIGHMAWFQEKWVLRDGCGEAPLRADGDALYDSSTVPHD